MTAAREPKEGKAPPTRVEIVFDGGSLGNPGKGYGSYQLRIGDEPPTLGRREFGPRLTNNQAEYMALIAGLEGAVAQLEKEGRSPRDTHLEVRGESKLVLEQVQGHWKVNHVHLRPLCDTAKALVGQFGTSKLIWHPRARSVAILGH